MELIKTYFDNLSEDTIEKLRLLGKHTTEWNEKINLISRKDIDNFDTKHLLHSLAIQKYVVFKPGSRILDLGTGGGLPGLPLAILNPEVEFKLIDARAKKIMVVNDLIKQLGLQNASAEHIRAEELKGKKFDFVVSRAVAQMEVLFNWTSRLIGTKEQNSIPNGLIALKGGDIKKELSPLKKRTYTEYIPLRDYFDLEEFEDKYVVYAQR